MTARLYDFSAHATHGDAHDLCELCHARPASITAHFCGADGDVLYLDSCAACESLSGCDDPECVCRAAEEVTL